MYKIEGAKPISLDYTTNVQAYLHDFDDMYLCKPSNESSESPSGSSGSPSGSSGSLNGSSGSLNRSSGSPSGPSESSGPSEPSEPSEPLPMFTPRYVYPGYLIYRNHIRNRRRAISREVFLKQANVINLFTNGDDLYQDIVKVRDSVYAWIWWIAWIAWIWS